MFNLPPDVTAAELQEQRHKAVEALSARWKVALDAYDGEGGFVDGSYIWKFPREIDSEFTARKTQARYHNYAATVVDYYVRKVFGAGVTRETTSEPLRAFWANVDGAGTDLTTFLRLSLAKALAAGHVGIFADKTQDDPTGPAVADEKAAVYLTRFLPTAILDWRLEQDEAIRAVKLVEDVETVDLLADDDGSQRVLLWDKDEWVRVTDAKDGNVTRANHTLGLVPLVVLRPFRHARWPFVGKPLLDPSVIRAQYNRASEQDEVIRNQSFSVLVVGLPTTGDVDVEKAKQALGTEIGTTRALFAYGSATYQTPSQEVSGALESHQTFLIRELYRQAHVPFEKDSRDAQSADALRLQHEGITAVLKGVADECQRVEIALAKLFFAWTTPNPAAAQTAFDAANVTVTYSDQYFATDPETDLKALAAAVGAVDSETFDKVIQAQIVQKFAADLDRATLDTIKEEIKNHKPEPAMDPTAIRQGAEARLQQALAQQQAQDVTNEGAAA